MPGLREFLFGSDALKKAAGDTDKTPPPSKGDAGLDIAAMAQKQADQAKDKSGTGFRGADQYNTVRKSPLSTTMNPQTKNGKNK